MPRYARISSGIQRIVAAIGPPIEGGAVANAITAFTQPTTPKLVRPVKIAWRNRVGANADLAIGFGSLAGLFRCVLPLIATINGFDGYLTEEDLPVAGNTPRGFYPDTTAVTGTAGDILIASSSALLGVGTPLEVVLELEIIA